MTRYKVGYLVGSLAAASINRKLAHALIRLAPDGMEFNEISFRDLPLYSYDYDDDFPAVARERLVWHPAGARQPFTLQLGDLFRPV